jgi:hypothetical protein
MFKIHGWATICFTPENRDQPDEDALQAAAIEQVRGYVQQLGYDPIGYQVSDQTVQKLLSPGRYSGQVVSAARANVVLGFGLMNDQARLWAVGVKNHATPLRQEMLDVYTYIGQVAPGSYGLLYMLDDEDPRHENAFSVFVLVRGTLTERADPFLSPFVPTVEDPYRED